MLPNISEKLAWLEKHPNILNNINRGIERETLRVTSDGYLSEVKHSNLLGSALTHKYITTDFAETLLEFITPIHQNIDCLLSFLRDIHRYVSRALGTERLWPFSMPCFIDNLDKIQLAQYGKSNIARMKMLYRKGLKTRYGSLMQIIAGVHYNFSLPILFWDSLANFKRIKISKEMISNEYLNLIRNYYRFGWIIPYLFGASPAMSSTFIKINNNTLPLRKNDKGFLFLPYATSLRLSDMGYTNRNKFFINLNSLYDYTSSVIQATKTPYHEYVILGDKDLNGNQLQLNTNILQIENELYAPIRPKNISLLNETPSEALLRGGIKYLEIRSLDVNPFSPIGIDANQIRFLDLFLIWCLLLDSPKINNQEDFEFYGKNWNSIILEGRKPLQKIILGVGNIKNEYSLLEVGKALFSDLYCLAKIFDKTQNNNKYQTTCDQLILSIYNSQYTYSARILKEIQNKGFNEAGIFLSNYYYDLLIKEEFEVINEKNFLYQAIKSINDQIEIEKSDTIDFESYLYNHNQNI